MTNSDGSDPRRGPRRYGPTSGSGEPPNPPRQTPPDRAPRAASSRPPGSDDFDDSTTIYSGDRLDQSTPAPRYPPSGSGGRPGSPPPGGRPPAGGYQQARDQQSRDQHQRGQQPGPYPAAGAPRPPAPQTPAWSQTNPPTAKFPSQPEQPPVTIRPGTGGYPGMSAAVPAAYGGGTPPGGRPPGPPPVPAGQPGEPRGRRVSGGVLAARIVALVAAVAVLLGVGIGWAVTGTLEANSGTSDAAGNAGNGGVISEGGMTILLVGSDARTDSDGNPLSAEELAQVGTEDDGGGLNTDTIMLVHIPEGGGKATAVSLPRDTWIGPKVMSQVVGPYADGTEGAYNANKINSFYSTAKAYTEQRLVNEGVTDKAQIERDSNEAGRTMLIRVVQAFSGMKIDHYAEVNLLGFYLLSNAIGGVPVCLNAAVNDEWSGANFPAGPQEVQGTAALAFVRQRHGLPEGDLDRVRRQQAFLAGTADKILSVGTLTDPTKLGDLVGAIDRSVIFDKGFSVLTFAEQITNLSSGNINFETLPTTGPESSTDKDALATDPAQVRAFFAAISGGSTTTQAAPETAVSVDPATVTVDVQDGTIADGVTAHAADTINQAGFALGSLGVVAGTAEGNEVSTTEIHYPAGSSGAAQQVADAFGVGDLVEDDAVADNHILVVVGQDLEVPPAGLRAPGAALAVAAAAAAPALAPAPQAAFAASVPCVN